MVSATNRKKASTIRYRSIAPPGRCVVLARAGTVARSRASFWMTRHQPPPRPAQRCSQALLAPAGELIGYFGINLPERLLHRVQVCPPPPLQLLAQRLVQLGGQLPVALPLQGRQAAEQQG